jgi:hypothetical protein
MILSDLLGQPVSCGPRIGYVNDVRFLLDEDDDHATGEARLYGLIVGPRARASYLGYERRGVRAPWPIAAFQRRRHRGTVLIRWSDVTSLTNDGIQLQPGYRRYAPQLD